MTSVLKRNSEKVSDASVHGNACHCDVNCAIKKYFLQTCTTGFPAINLNYKQSMYGAYYRQPKVIFTTEFLVTQP